MKNGIVAYIGTILIWIAVVLLWVFRGWWWITAALFILHLVETILIGVKTGTANGKSNGYSIFMTLMFGITWWRPLKNKEKEQQ